MSAAEEWRKQFLGRMRYLHSRGWNRPFIVWGGDLRVPGMIASFQVFPTPANDA